ncbi:MAG: hypothetical protein ACI9YH_004881 [Colwellia sp.]|jgi:hypothetical protein
MSKNRPSYSSAITDALFVLLPFLVLILLRLMQSDISRMLIIPDYSLALSIMYGQLLSKTLSVPDHKKQSDQFKLFQIIIFLVSVLSVIAYSGFQIIEDIPLGIYYSQIVIFIIGLFMYVPFLTLMNKLNND